MAALQKARRPLRVEMRLPSEQGVRGKLWRRQEETLTSMGKCGHPDYPASFPQHREVI
jgi:hypothetical protein